MHSDKRQRLERSTQYIMRDHPAIIRRSLNHPRRSVITASEGEDGYAGYRLCISPTELASSPTYRASGFPAVQALWVVALNKIDGLSVPTKEGDPEGRQIGWYSHVSRRAHYP